MELSQIKGLKSKRIEVLQRAGIYSPEDLILHFPTLYADINSPPDFSNMSEGEAVAFKVTLVDKPVYKYVRKGLGFVKAKFQLINDVVVTATWFNQSYIIRQLQSQSEFLLSGKYKKVGRNIEITAPSISVFKSDSPSIIPIYKGIKGLSSSLISEAVKTVLDNIQVNGYFDEEILQKYSLMPLSQAVRLLHFPSSLDKIAAAQKTVALENLAYTISVYNILKQNSDSSRNFFYKQSNSMVQELIKSLPFSLTDDQNKAFSEILDCLNSNKRMNRLLLGDVGCGKTIVAFICMYYAAVSGYQSVLMAPTEILARQHYQNAIKIFEGLDVNVELLVGGMEKGLRDTKRFNIKNGVAQIIIGTHSLISEDILYNNLSLVITDEQQRFGVSQRAELENKTKGADILVMSATPIPRTLALTLYGDLQQSVIKTMPASKAKVLTRIVPLNKIDEMYKYLRKNADENLQSYIVCPRVDDEDDTLTSATSLFEQVKGNFAHGEAALLHGQMKEKEKQSVMQQFASGKIKVLVTTTIIEVGVDVKNAVNIVIYDPDRYGLSQLHQLRGRVGRGSITSYCFLVEGFSATSKQRIEYFASCNNGFELAEFDFMQRGAGDFLGTRQHGGNLNISKELLKTAKEISDYLVCIPAICSEIIESISERQNEYIRSLTLN